MNILIIGQCTLHWGRMEFGNIGNFYIIEPFVRELYENFPDAHIKTTFQMSKRFCEDEKVEVLPIELYYGWRENELFEARREIEISCHYRNHGKLEEVTPYIEAVMWADLVIDFSGDIWGDNANFLGANRFEVGLLKNQIAINLGKKVVMLAGSPGPFSNEETKRIALDVYKQFDLVTNREPISTRQLEHEGFDVSRTHSLACPAFLFEPAKGPAVERLLEDEGLSQRQRRKPVVGFVVCGWNFEVGPFDKWPRKDDEYLKFVEGIEYIVAKYDISVCLMSHSNGFDVPPAPFELKHGRDYPIAKQLHKVLMSRGSAENIFILDGVYSAWETKAIIGSFDMLVSGRIHAAVAGLSQGVPTVILDYGHEPKAHKLKGFSEVAGVEGYIADPTNLEDIKEKLGRCWNDRDMYKRRLEERIPPVKELAKKNFSMLKKLFQ